MGRIKWVVATAVVVGLLAWWTAGPPYVYRYRLTIEVMTPDGLRSGSSVIEVRSSKTTVGLHEMRGVRSALYGEAVFIDLGRGKNLLAVLAGGPKAADGTVMVGMPVVAFGLEKSSWEEQQAALMGPLAGKRAEVPERALPTLVTFSDLNDPRSARLIDPSDLERTLGPGVKFSRAWIEMTGDQVTRGIEKKLSWWSLPGRPAGTARRALLEGDNKGSSVEPEKLFIRN